MKKIITLCLFLALLWPAKNFAQVTLYSYSTQLGTYTPITGTAATVSNLDEGVTALLPIGFSFWYDGATYTNLSASTNGSVKLGGVMSTASNTYYKNLGYSTERPMIAPLVDDLALTATDGIRYETSGTAPNRVFTLQWSGVKWGKGAANAGIEFQVKLYETSNRIEFVYNQLAGSLSYAYATIGITTQATSDNSYASVVSVASTPTVSYFTPTSGNNGKPATGRVVTFTPPVLCSTPPDGGAALASTVSTCAGINFTLSVNTTPDTYGLTFQWQSSADGTTWQNIAGATGRSVTLTQTAASYYRRAITCSGVTGYSEPVRVNQGGGAPVYASVPYTQNFDAAWESNCATRDIPSASWRNTVPTGNRSWRREDDYLAGGWENNNGWLGGTSSHAARFHVRDESSSGTPATGSFDLYVDCSSAGSKELRFKHIESTYGDHLSVLYSTDGGVTFTLLGKVVGINQWRSLQFRLPTNSATTVIRFQGTGQAYSSYSDIGLDDVQVVNVACTYPSGFFFTDVTQTTATANWAAIDGVAGYEYAVTSSATPPATGTATTATSATISGLTAASKYYLHVRAKCNATDFSSWSSQLFGTAMDCSSAAPISCGTPASFSFGYAYGTYNLFETDPSGNCGKPMLGAEKLLRFTPPVTGVYSLKVTNTNSSYEVAYSLKDAAGGCAPMGWTCLGMTVSGNTFSMGTLIAGKEYYILVDQFTVVNAHSETLEIICPAANSDCASAAITPASGVICSGSAIQLNTSGGTAYQWYRDGVAINGATAATYEAALPGTYRVAITNGSCTAVSTNAAVLTAPAVPVVTAASAASFCQGGSVVLSTTAADGYQWYRDGNLLTGATQQTYTAQQAGAYSVKVTREGCLSDASAAQTATVNPLPAVPVVTASGSTSVCAGEQVTLTTPSVSGYTYVWQSSGADFPGTNYTQFSFIPTVNGSFTVKVTTPQGCSATSLPKDITVNPKPAEPVITAGGPTSFCQGGSVVLSSSAASGNQWYFNNEPIAGAQGTSYTATQYGSYRVFATIGSCSTGSGSQAVNVIATPTVTITASGPTEFCAGGSVVLQATTDFNNNNTYQWKLNGGAIANATATTYTANIGGSYTVTATRNGCPGTSAATQVTVYSYPSKPLITQVGNTLSTSGTGTFQWYFNGVAVAGATSAQHTATTSGLYTVQVSQYGCSTTSDAVNFVATALVQPQAWNNEVVVYPNPVQDFVRITNSGGRKLTVKLMDVAGRVVYTGVVHATSSSIRTEKLAPGSYWLILTDSRRQETLIKVLVKQ